ncbi:MAG: hypothetical protein KAU21_05560 [Gammaproteobacteria bacterium]|nr:hypothetical protein [Gammaproteobacteria bacterium]
MPESNFHNFQVDDVAIRYSNFAPRLFNFCLSLGMKPNSIMPSRAFCSDENQGYPIILLAKHFGTFPFNHGRVGGIVASDRHGPHSHHGKDVVLIQASHVGYDPASREFGVYRRLQTEDQSMSSDCGALCGVLHWYQEEYNFASQQIYLDHDGERMTVVIDNQLLREDREEGLMLNFEQLVQNKQIVKSYSTAKSFLASEGLIEHVGSDWPEKKTAIGNWLLPESFYFKRKMDDQIASGLLNRNLIHAMPGILASTYPPLAAAQVNAQMEFDRTFRTIVKEKSYRGKKVVFVSGIHIDISPKEGQLFPLTKFVPWAAYIQNEKGEGYTLEQHELFEALTQQSAENPYKIDLTQAIHAMESEPEVHLHVDSDQN